MIFTVKINNIILNYFLVEIIPIKTRLFFERTPLVDFIRGHIRQLREGDIVVITSKIVALSQGRVGLPTAKKELIYSSSKKVIETPWALVTLTDDGWCINAGVDESNADGRLILPPKDPRRTATTIHKKLLKHFSLKNLGVLVTDTKSLPLRVGTIGRSIGYSGFEPLKSYIGKKDLFGRKSRFTQSNVADALAASAVLVMGEGDEQIPMAIVRNAPVHFTKRSGADKKRRSLILPPETDIFAAVFRDSERVSRKPPRKRHSAR